MAIRSRFLGAAGLLHAFGDTRSNTIVAGRDTDGTLLINDSIVEDDGVAASVDNTRLISVFGDSGNDTITLDESHGALPNSHLFGGNGNDIITGGSGADQIFGEAGNDTLNGRGGADLLFGGAGDDLLFGGAGDDQMFGGAGIDRIVWNPGDGTDLADGGSGEDTLEVNGGNGNEIFTIAANGARVRVDRIDPAPFSIDANAIEEIVIRGGGGDDTFSAIGNLAALAHLTLDGGDGNDVIRGGNGNDLLLGGSGNDFVDGQQGADTARLGAGNDVFQWDPGDGSDMVDGESGTDTLLFNGDGAAENFRISANGSRALLTRDIGTIEMRLNGIERIELNALGNNDNILIDDLSRTAVREIAIDLADADGGGDEEADMVAVNATDRADRIDIVANGSSVSVMGLSARVTIDGSQVGNDALVVSGLGGNDTISAATLPADIIHLIIDGGAGNDTITGSRGGDTLHGGAGNDAIIGGAGSDLVFLGEGNDVFVWNPGDGSDQVEGGEGTDTLEFVGAAGDEAIDIVADLNGGVRLFRNIGNVAMDLDDVERIEIDASDGADSIVVGNLAGTDVRDVVVELGAADSEVDSVTVNGTNGDDRISVVSSGNSVLVRGLSGQVTIRQSEGEHDTLTISGLGGNDTIDASALRTGQVNLLTIDGGLGDDDIIGSRGDDIIDGGGGTDTMRGGAGDDTFVWDPGDGSDVIDGQSGADTLIFNGSDASERFEISAQADGHVLMSRNVGGITQNLNNVETIELNAQGANDTIVINDLTGTDVTQINVDLGVPGGDADAQPDTIVVNGSNGDDVITLSIENGALVINGLSSRIVIDNFDFDSDTVHVAGLGGNDVIDASAIGDDGARLIFDGGAGDDILLGGGGNDVLNGGDGDDVLIGFAGLDVLDGGAGDNVLIQDGGPALATLQELNPGQDVDLL